MHVISEEEWRAFLIAEPHTGKLAMTRKDGRPHVAPGELLVRLRPGPVVAQAAIAD
jgi:hypothetical protein